MSKTTVTSKWYYEFSALINGDKETKKYAILKPNRKIREDGELFFASETSRFAKAGVLPRAAWNTILSNGGGTISDSERETYGKLLGDYRSASFELQAILIKNDGTRSDVENKRIEELLAQIEQIKKDVQSFESEQINIFENTAEAKARNRTILWWVLNMAYTDDNGEYKPMFAGETFNDKLDSYDAIEESGDEFYSATVKRLTYLVTLWFLGRAEKTEDFQQIDNDFISALESDEKKDEDSSETTDDGVEAIENGTSEQDAK